MTEQIDQKFLDSVIQDKLSYSKNKEFVFRAMYARFFNHNRDSISYKEVHENIFLFRKEYAYGYKIIQEFKNLGLLKEIPVKSRTTRFQMINEESWKKVMNYLDKNSKETSNG